MKSYEALAAVYDRLNDQIDYAAWGDYFERCFARYGCKPQLVLDLGCGTGSMTLELCRRGYDMIGVDASAEMLSRAMERMYREGKGGILFLQQDMREFELYGTVGAVVSTLDCVNYLTGEGDLDRCFALVHNYLDPDGVFLFDVNTPYKFRHVYGDNAYILEEETDEGACFCGWQNEFDEQSGLCRFSLSVFEELEDGSYSRRDEEQTERCYSREELSAALERAGFGDIAFFGDFECNAPGADCERWYVAARCKK